MSDITFKVSFNFWVIIVIWLSISFCFAADTDYEQSSQEFYEKPLEILNATANQNTTIKPILSQTTLGNVNFGIVSTTPSDVIVIIDSVPADPIEATPKPNIADALKASCFQLPLSIMAVLLSTSWSYKTDFF